MLFYQCYDLHVGCKECPLVPGALNHSRWKRVSKLASLLLAACSLAGVHVQGADEKPQSQPVSAQQGDSSRKGNLPVPAEPIITRLPPTTESGGAGRTPQVADLPVGQPITLSEAIALAYRRQPRLRAYMEGIEQAQGNSDIAFAPFLPAGAVGYSVGGFDLNVGGAPLTSGSGPGFTVIPPGFALPVGLNIHTGYELADLKMQWLICDFGRRMGRYNASKLAVEIHQLANRPRLSNGRQRGGPGLL